MIARLLGLATLALCLAGAPAFADLQRRYTAPGLLRELEASDAVGHYGMPVVSTSAA